jgi:acyl carrier protein
MTYEQIFNFVITIITNHRNTWYPEDNTKITIKTHLINDLHFDSLDIEEFFLDIENNILGRPVTKKEIQYLRHCDLTIETLINFAYQKSYAPQQIKTIQDTSHKSKLLQKTR